MRSIVLFFGFLIITISIIKSELQMGLFGWTWVMIYFATYTPKPVGIFIIQDKYFKLNKNGKRKALDDLITWAQKEIERLYN